MEIGDVQIEHLVEPIEDPVWRDEPKQREAEEPREPVLTPVPA